MQNETNAQGVTFNPPELAEKYNELNDENKKLFIAKYYELLAEQNAEANNHYVYFFDCLDGILSEKYWSAAELNKAMTGAADPMPERDIIKIARNYEATLYRYEMSKDNKPINEAILYDPFDM